MAKPKRKRTAAERRARRERKKTSMIIFINGKQKRVPRPQLIDGLPVEEFIARNADPRWLHENELWELTPNADALLRAYSSGGPNRKNIRPVALDLAACTLGMRV